MVSEAQGRQFVLHLPALTPLQAEVASDSHRFKVAALGRGCGKSTFAQELAIADSCNNAGYSTWYIGPSFREVSLQWRELQALLPPGFPCDIHQADRRVVFHNGSEIVFQSAHVGEKALRGGQRDHVIFEEAASIPDGLAIWQHAIRPSLVARNGKATFIGTPRGHNWFYSLFRMGADGLDPEWASWQRPSSANPFLPPDEIERARAELPDRVFRQEFLAEFISDGAVFQHVDECCGDTSAFGTGPVVLGVDWGKHEDFTAVVGYDTEHRVLKLLHRSNQVSYRLQRDRLAHFHEQYHPAVILVESNSIGGPNLEELVSEGLPAQGFETTAQSKPQIIESMMLATERQEVIFDSADEVMLAEFKAYAIARTPSGRYTYGAPSGMHDDCVMAAAIAREAANRAGRFTRIEWV
jgi:hypothetical protein